MSAMDGFNSEFYVPGSYNCSVNTRLFQIDALRTQTNFNIVLPATTIDMYEDVTFNTTATMSANFPDAIYYCYFVPGTAYSAWT